jgi:hypothetical protein
MTDKREPAAKKVVINRMAYLGQDDCLGEHPDSRFEADCLVMGVEAVC